MTNSQVAVFIMGLYVLIVGQGWLANWDGRFSPRQFRKYGIKGMPWCMHGGVAWGDPFLVTPIVAIALYLYRHQWSIEEHWLQVTIVWAVNIYLHYQWSRGKVYDSIACRGRISATGVLHFVYMGTTLTVITFLYLDTVGINPTLLVVFSILLTIHLALGSHVVPSLINVVAHNIPMMGFRELRWWPVNTLTAPDAMIPMIGCWCVIWARTGWILSHQ